jgi:NAD(P)-dependent dehydrogenase (short-subunit alcohol dehydrogenase family)
MDGRRRTAIVTGASQGIGAGIAKRFVEHGFNVVANARGMPQSTELLASDSVAMVDGHIGEPATAAKIVETALSRFRSIDILVNNAGLYIAKPFTDYTTEDFQLLTATNVAGFLYVTQLAITQMLAQKTRGERRHDHSGPRPQPDPWCDGLPADVHQGRPRDDHPAPRDGVREGWHSRERGRARGFLHPASVRDASGRDGKQVADGTAFDNRGHHGCGHVPERRRYGHG